MSEVRPNFPTAIELTAVEAMLVDVLPEAGHMAMVGFEKAQHEEFAKEADGTDFSTPTDLSVDAFLIEKIRDCFPEATFLTEETAEDKAFDRFRGLGNLFIIDSIDGTANFARGNPNFGISVGWVQQGQPKLGAIYLPTKKQLIVARADQPGMEVNGQIEHWHVSATEGLAQATVLIDVPHDQNLKPYTAWWTDQLSNHVRRIGMEGSAVSDMIKVANGSVDAYVHPGLLPWDVAAAAVILEKAGAVITRSDGSPWDIFSPDIVVSNPVLQPKIISKLSSIN